MNALHANHLLIFGIFLTLVLFGIYPILPQNKLDLIDNPDFTTIIQTTKNERGENLGFWVDESQHIWACDIPENLNKSIYQTCSLNVELTRDMSKGIDLSGFSTLTIEMKYKGTSDRFRVSMRNFNSEYSNMENLDTAKYHSLTVDRSDLDPILNIQLEEFWPADWWIAEFKIPRKYAGRDLSNVFILAIDLEDLPIGFHQMQVTQIRFSGNFVRRDNWYLLILSPWLIGILIYAINQIRLLKLQTQIDRQEIYQLAQKNSSLTQLSDEFRRLSTIDPLTQCYNRFGIHQIITRLESPEYSIYSPRYSLIMIDIDYFKRINDRRGHDTGDRVLQTISKIIQEKISDHYFTGRWGGEEFIIILPNTHEKFSLALAEKLRLIIYDTVFEPDNPINVTASFGVTEHKPNEDFATTFKRADTALYRAKHQGRNCCILAEA